ncbi:MAG: helix-turn-helix domain-containing protein, partial [Candidatus Hodarchaeales archaeon]
MSLGLDSLDLELNESKIYIILLAHGPRSVGEIMLETELSSADVEDSVSSLKRKGYVYEISGLANRFDAIIPFQDLKKAGEKTIAQLESLASEIGQDVSHRIDIIREQMEKEKQVIQNSFSEAEGSINQLDTNAESNTEELIAKTVIEIETTTESSKDSIQTAINDKQNEHKALLANVEGKVMDSAGLLSDKFSEINNQVKSRYQTGIDELSTAENTRVNELDKKVNNISDSSQEKIVAGLQEVQKSLENTSKLLTSSIDKEDGLFEDNIVTTS